MDSIGFEEGLAGLLRESPGALLSHLALAERAGICERVLGRLRQQLADGSDHQIELWWFGGRSFREIVSLWDALRQSNAPELANSVQTQMQDSTELSSALESLIEPLLLLGRGPMLRGLQGALGETPSDSFTETAAVALGACGEWQDAVGVLEHAHRDGARPHINLVAQTSLWQHAYLQGEIDTVLPRLAAIPFNRERAHAAEDRRWQLAAYRLRAGRADIQVPVLAESHHTLGYIEAAAIALAAHEATPSLTRPPAELRAVLSPRTITFHFVSGGIQVPFTSDPLAAARIRIAARRHDYALLATLADAQASSPPIVIDALLEEGDWLGASEFAERHDPREQPVFEGFDDTRMHEHCRLQLVLAAAAARGGADEPARVHLAEHVEALRLLRQEQDEWDADTGLARPAEAPAPGLRTATLLAGAAEGVLPRPLLAMLLPAFRNTL